MRSQIAGPTIFQYRMASVTAVNADYPIRSQAALYTIRGV